MILFDGVNIYGYVLMKGKNKAEKRHDKLVQHYAIEDNIDFLELDSPVKYIYKEPVLRDIFKEVKSYKTPDLIYITELNDIYVGEVKGRNSFRNRKKAYGQVMKYHYILQQNRIESNPFTILGKHYKEIINLQ